MYTQRIIHAPALGKNQELRAALEARTATANAQRSPHSLSARMFSAEPALIHNIRFESLAAIEAYQQKNAGDSAFADATQKITNCLSRPQSMELWESSPLVPPSAPPAFTLRVRYLPAAGKVGELRAVLEERAKRGVPGATGSALSLQVAPPAGPAMALTILFSSLAGMDEFRSSQAADSSFLPFIAKVNSLTTGPGGQELLRILQPFPPD